MIKWIIKSSYSKFLYRGLTLPEIALENASADLFTSNPVTHLLLYLPPWSSLFSSISHCNNVTNNCHNNSAKEERANDNLSLF